MIELERDHIAAREALAVLALWVSLLLQHPDWNSS